MLIPEVNSGYPILSDDSDSIYLHMRYWKPGLMLDVGAAAGHITKKMLDVNPKSKIIAFEPFPGNFKYFEDTIGIDDRVTLIKKAVSNRCGRLLFHVSSVVRGVEPGWEHMPGYSSLGRLVNHGGSDIGTIDVDSCCLDDVVSESVRFCKIDVQGGELEVLYGASKIISEYGIDVFRIELGCGNELEILEYMHANNYYIFDGAYLLVVVNEKPDLESWWNIRNLKLSTGKEAYYGRPKDAPRSFSEYSMWLKEESKKIGHVATDLICVNKKFMADFMSSVGQSKDLFL